MFGPLRPAFADDAPFTKEWKDFTFYTPVLSGPAVGHGYDFVGKEHLIMAETRLAGYKNLAFLTFGGAFEADGAGDGELKKGDRQFLDGVPYLGLHTEISLWKIFHVGGFYARDFDLSKNLAGVKTNFVIPFGKK